MKQGTQKNFSDAGRESGTGILYSVKSPSAYSPVSGGDDPILGTREK